MMRTFAYLCHFFLRANPFISSLALHPAAISCQRSSHDVSYSVLAVPDGNKSTVQRICCTYRRLCDLASLLE